MALFSMTEHQASADVALRNMTALAQSEEDITAASQMETVSESASPLASEDVPENGSKLTFSFIRNGEPSSSKPVPELVHSSETALKSLGAEERGTDPSISTGRWTRSEHEAFLQGLAEFGREWKKVAERIQTRNSAQIRSHAQKYFAKLAKEGNQQSISKKNSSGSLCALHPLQFASTADKSIVLSPSVLAKIDQITKDPASVQKEVEQTLHRLHERYTELKMQLEQAHQRNLRKKKISPALHITNLNADATAAAAVVENEEEKKWSFSSRSVNHLPSGSVGETRPTVMPEIGLKRPLSSFGKEELIALEVLGGGLPQSAAISEFQKDRRVGFRERLRGEIAQPASATGLQKEMGGRARKRKHDRQ